MNAKTRAKLKTYCVRCYFTIYEGELVNVETEPVGYRHINCRAAIEDGKGRQINPDYKHFLKGFDPDKLDKVLGKHK